LKDLRSLASIDEAITLLAEREADALLFKSVEDWIAHFERNVKVTLDPLCEPQ
jgi:hypothetical protein